MRKAANSYMWNLRKGTATPSEAAYWNSFAAEYVHQFFRRQWATTKTLQQIDGFIENATSCLVIVSYIENISQDDRKPRKIVQPWQVHDSIFHDACLFCSVLRHPQPGLHHKSGYSKSLWIKWMLKMIEGLKNAKWCIQLCSFCSQFSQHFCRLGSSKQGRRSRSSQADFSDYIGLLGLPGLPVYQTEPKKLCYLLKVFWTVLNCLNWFKVFEFKWWDDCLNLWSCWLDALLYSLKCA